MIHNILHNRTLLVMVIIVHLLAGFSYGHAAIPKDGEMFHVGNLHLNDQDVETACHDERQDQTQVSPDVDCAGQCLTCCSHGPCGLLVIVLPLDILSPGSELLALQTFAKAIHPFVEPRPPRSLRHYA